MALTSVPHSVWGKIAPTFMVSAYLDELLQASQPGRVGLALVAIAPVGERHFADVDVAMRVDGQPVRRHELARLEPGRALAQPRQHLALVTVDADPRPDVGHVVVDAHAAADLADVEAALRAGLHEQARGTVHVVPLGLELAVPVEHLDAMVLAVGDVDPAVPATADVVRNVELAGIGAGLAPRAEQRAVRSELVDARVAVAVRDVEIALRRERSVRAAVKRLAAHVGFRRAGDAERQQHLAVQRAVPDGVVAVIGQPDRVVRGHVDAVRPTKHPFAPGTQKIAVPVEHDHRVLAPIERVHPVLLVDSDRSDVGVEFAPPAQLRPLIDDLVTMWTRAQDDRHHTSPLYCPLHYPRASGESGARGPGSMVTSWSVPV